jgi:hypothetical protein
LFGGNYTEARNLNSLVSYLLDELNRKNAALTDEQIKTNDLRKQMEKSLVDNKAISDAAVEGQKKAEADLTAARAEFEKQLAANTAKMTEISGALDKVQRQLGEIEVTKRLLADKQKEFDDLTVQYQKMSAIVNQGDADLSKVPVAEVTYANQLADTITINRVLADGVRRQMTFSVYNQNETNIARATPKASVEVVAVTDLHRSECRIISGEIKDPIISGDVLYTPAWKPGQKVHFALGPNMDLDGDGEATAEELETLRGLIALNGGVVDAYAAIDGTIKNDKDSEGIGYATRFYVVGLSPRRDQREIAQKLDADTAKFGVEKINIGKMLDYMGYQVKRTTRSIVNSPTPILERRPPGAGQPTNAAPRRSPTEKPATEAPKEPAGEDPFADPKTPPAADDPFATPKPAGEAPKKPAAPGDDPFAG